MYGNNFNDHDLQIIHNLQRGKTSKHGPRLFGLCWNSLNRLCKDCHSEQMILLSRLRVILIMIGFNTLCKLIKKENLFLQKKALTKTALRSD